MTHLKTVTYTKDWDSKLKHGGVDMGCIGIVNGVRRTRKDHTYLPGMSVLKGGWDHSNAPLGLKLRSLIFWVHGINSA